MAVVTNPYTFNITANKTVKATISLAIPTTKTELGNGIEINIEFTQDTEQYSITIPTGVNVILIEDSYSDNSGENWREIEYQKNSGNWTRLPALNNNGTTYVGVTAGATYTFKYTVNAYNDIVDAYFNTYYSQTINSQTPKFTI